MSSRLPKILFKTPWALCWRWQGICVYAIQKTPKKLGWNGIVDHTSKLALLSFTAITYILLLSVPSILTPPLPKSNQNGYSMWKFEESTACFKLIQSLGFIYLFMYFNQSYSGSLGTEGWYFQGFIFPGPAIPQTNVLNQFLWMILKCSLVQSVSALLPLLKNSEIDLSHYNLQQL